MPFLLSYTADLVSAFYTVDGTMLDLQQNTFHIVWKGTRHTLWSNHMKFSLLIVQNKVCS